MKFFSGLFTAMMIGCIGQLNSQVCSGAPAANTAIASSTLLCPGSTVTLSLLNPNTNSGIAYQWLYSSATAFGPWAAINGANGAALLTNTLSNSGYYTAVVICTPALATTTAAAVYIDIGSASTTSTTPYYESFEVLAGNGLPNCAWWATNWGSNTMTFTNVASSGFVAAGFTYSATSLGNNTFYSMGLLLNTGIVYSVSVNYKTQLNSPSNNWSSFGISVVPSWTQGGVVVTNSAAPAAFANYAARSGTFTVATPGIYNIGVFANSVAGTTVSPQLYFDDLSLTVPCSLAGNMASATISPNPVTLCSGDSVKLTFAPDPASITGVAGNTLYIKPALSSILSFPITNTISGCVRNQTVLAIVSPAPNIVAMANPPSICQGQTSTLSLFGGFNYTLNPPGSGGNNPIVSPSVTTIYTITGGASTLCVSQSTVQVIVNQKPTIVLTSDTLRVCSGETATMNVTGAISYSCNYSGAIVASSQITFPPINTSTQVTVFGEDNKQCVNTATFSLKVDACSGISSLEKSELFKIYPNPTNGILNFVTSAETEVVIMNSLGQVVYAGNFTKGLHQLDFGGLASGVYLVRVTNESKNFKLVKE